MEPTFQQTIFDLIEALSRGDLSGALKLYKGLRSAKSQPLYILSMLGWQLRNLLVTASAEGHGPREIVADFSMSPYVVGKAMQVSGRVPLTSLKQLHSHLLATDHRLKSTNLDPDILLEQFLTVMASRLKQAV